MVYGELPVTLPINATDDRVIGGWRIESLLVGEAVQQPGLLKRAGQQGILYVDEVNLLDDHIVNIILDAASTGVLSAQREGLDSEGKISFGLVGTMNPEEGGLRPQLLDRFGLLVPVSAESDAETRADILFTVLHFAEELENPKSEWLEEGRRLDAEWRERLLAARERRRGVTVPRDIVRLCGRIAAEFAVAGHRGEITMLRAARALASIEGRAHVTPDDVHAVTSYAILHRRPQAGQGADATWSMEDEEGLQAVISRVPGAAA
jgi:magnesium chelatase subunit I